MGSVAPPSCNVTLATIIARAILAIFLNDMSSLGLVLGLGLGGVRVLRMDDKEEGKQNKTKARQR